MNEDNAGFMAGIVSLLAATQRNPHSRANRIVRQAVEEVRVMDKDKAKRRAKAKLARKARRK